MAMILSILLRDVKTSDGKTTTEGEKNEMIRRWIEMRQRDSRHTTFYVASFLQVCLVAANLLLQRLL